MPDLSDLGRQILEANSTLAELERSLAGSPESRALSMTIESIKRNKRQLEAAFLEEANQVGVDVCSYRLFSESGLPTAVHLGRALEGLQTAISTVYAALRTRVALRSARISAEAASESALTFGYAFSGSVGFVLTIPNERRLFGASTLDESVDLVFELAKAESPRVIASYAERLGPASIRAIYKWASVLVAGDLGAEVEWRRVDEVRSRVLIQVPELEHLRSAIEATSDASIASVVLDGMLVGLQSERRTFDLAFEGGAHIHGSLSEEFSLDVPLRIPSRYFATLTKTTRTRYSVDEDEETWELEHLEAI